MTEFTIYASTNFEALAKERYGVGVADTSVLGDVLDPGKTEKEKLVSEAHTFEAMPGFVYIVESKSGKLLGILAKQKGTENFLRDIKARDVLSRQNLRPLRG
jgi:hypothetical protein